MCQDVFDSCYETSTNTNVSFCTKAFFWVNKRRVDLFSTHGFSEGSDKKSIHPCSPSSSRFLRVMGRKIIRSFSSLKLLRVMFSSSMSRCWPSFKCGLSGTEKKSSLSIINWGQRDSKAPTKKKQWPLMQIIPISIAFLAGRQQCRSHSLC